MYTPIMALIIAIFIVSGILTLTALAWLTINSVLSRRYRWSCTCGAEGTLWAPPRAPVIALVGKAVLCHDELLIKEHVPALFDICPHRITAESNDTQLSFDHDKAPHKEA